MNTNISKVNTRCIILCAFVFVISSTVQVSPALAQQPTRNPTEAENLRRRLEHDKLEAERDKYVQTGLSYDQIKKQSTKEIWDILGRLFSGVGQPNTSPSPGFLPPPGSNPPTAELQGVLPQGEPPAGRCTTLVNQALVNLSNHPSNLEVYRQASEQTGVPWEAIAAVHYIETGGSFNPNGSCISGRPIGAQEPDNGNQTYGSLLETCVAAAEEFKGKKGIVNYVRGLNNLPEPSTYEMLAGQFASYSAPTQGECAMGTSGAGYDFVYTGATWPGIPDKGQCRPKGEKFVGDRHFYATSCLDAAHEDVWFHFHYGGEVKLLTNRVGAITLIRAIQKLYAQIPQNPGGGTPGPIYPPPAGMHRSPRDAETIALEMQNRCNTGSNKTYSFGGGNGNILVDSVNSGNYSVCVSPLSSAGQRFKDKVNRWLTSVDSSALQCVGLAHAMTAEINGWFDNHYGNAADEFYSDANFEAVDRSRGPQPGYMVIFAGSPWFSAGHIAYVYELPMSGRFKVVEAHMNGRGSVSIGTYSNSNPTIKGFLRSL